MGAKERHPGAGGGGKTHPWALESPWPDRLDPRTAVKRGAGRDRGAQRSEGFLGLRALEGCSLDPVVEEGLGGCASQDRRHCFMTKYQSPKLSRASQVGKIPPQANTSAGFPALPHPSRGLLSWQLSKLVRISLLRYTSLS